MPRIFQRVSSFFRALFSRRDANAGNNIPSDTKINANLIKDKLFKVVGATEKSTNEEFIKYRVIETEEISEIILPSYYAKLILAKYYELKYGIKMAIERDSEGFEAIKSFIIQKCKENLDFTFGFIILGDSKKNYPNNQYDHCSAFTFEKKGDEATTIILDSTPSIFIYNKVSKLPANIASKTKDFGLKFKVLTTNTHFQRDANGCHNYAVAILKETLRLKEVMNSESLESAFETTNFKESNFQKASQFNYEKLPAPLLKYSQTTKPIEIPFGKVLKSSINKPPELLENYRARHQGDITLLETDEKKSRNLNLLMKGHENVERVMKVLDFYGIKDEEGLKIFCEKLDREQRESLKDFTFLKVKEMDNLPTWSRRKEEKITNQETVSKSNSTELGFRSFFTEASTPIFPRRKNPGTSAKNPEAEQAKKKSQENEKKIN